MSAIRSDLEIISTWITPGSRVLDLGCGDGELLHHLQQTRNTHGYGIEIDAKNVCACIARGINVIQTDLDHGLSDFKDQSFDFVIMTRTLQAVQQPDTLLDEILRIGKQGIITFPNFGHWRIRAYLALHGEMPISKTLPNTWYNTPNIHLCTVNDFEKLCAKKGFSISKRQFVDNSGRNKSNIPFLPNLFGEVALYQIQR